MIDRVVLATRNAGKARELEHLLRGMAGRLETLRDHPDVILPPETGSSYAENAAAKARAVRDALGMAAIGDDSGLEVDALRGAPGIHSARFAGEEASDAENVALLLSRLTGVPESERTARFRCVLVLARPGRGEALVEGVCEGAIVEVPRGRGGFGYDPVFLPRPETQTFAELPSEVKDRISHRARAALALREAIAGERG